MAYNKDIPELKNIPDGCQGCEYAEAYKDTGRTACGILAFFVLEEMDIDSWTKKGTWLPNCAHKDEYEMRLKLSQL